jgi:hypothetical protein
MGILKTAVKVGVASSVHGRVQRRQQRRWGAQERGVNAVQAETNAFPSAPAAPPAAAVTDSASQLELLAKLGELKNSGVLTEEEFQAKKADILNG